MQITLSHSQLINFSTNKYSAHEQQHPKRGPKLKKVESLANDNFYDTK